MGWLSLLIGLPLLAIGPIWVLPAKMRWQISWTLLVSLAQLVLYAAVIAPQITDSWAVFPVADRIGEYISWIELRWNTNDRVLFAYHLRLDGLNHPLILLTLILQPFVVFASNSIKHSKRAYFSLLLLLNAAILGCFLAFDLFLFYIFFEFMLLPMYFLIAYWGGTGREAAALKFFLYTLVGSLLLLVVLLALLLSYPFNDPSTGSTTYHLDLSRLVKLDQLDLKSILASSELRWLALGFVLLAFAIKLPVVPFHTWLPKAHVEAPTPISVVLAALLLKVGGYGLFRIGAGIFHDQMTSWAPLMGWLAIISIIYGGLVALSEQHLKRLIAYSSISHMGFVLLGLSAGSPEALAGAQLQMFNHGIVSAALFLLAGQLYERFHDYQINHYAGLLQLLPVYSFLTAWVFFAALGLPGLNTFVSEFLVLGGTFRAASQTLDYLPMYSVFLAGAGIFIAAAYFLYAYRRLFLGKPCFEKDIMSTQLDDLRFHELIVLVPLCLIMVLLGLFPSLILDLSDQTLSELATWLHPTVP